MTHDALISVIDELEKFQGWEPSSTTAAKAYAAYKVRQALGLELPDPRNAQEHVYHQRQHFERYTTTEQYEHDRAVGAECHFYEALS